MQTVDLVKLLALPKLPTYLKQVNKTLLHLVSVGSHGLSQPSLRITQSTGKRLRPVLAMASAQCLGAATNNHVIQGGAAVELIHMGTVVHDDIIDHADFRWGKPTVNKQEGVDQAILTGDYLLALAVSQASDISQEVSKIVADTIVTMSDGQSQEITDEYNPKRSVDDYLSVIFKKTAVLTSAACRIGGLCAGLKKDQVKALAKYGESFGMAYQLVDDLLDFLSTNEAMGKPVGNDLKEGVYTYPILFALKTNYKQHVSSWLGKYPAIKPIKEEVTKVLMKSGAVDATLAEIRRHNSVAAKAIKSLGKSDTIEGLASLPEIYLNWAIKKCPDLAQ